MKIKYTFLFILFYVFSFAQNEFITLWKPNIPSLYSTTNTQILFSGVGTNYTIYWEEVGNPSHNNTLANVTILKGHSILIDFGAGLSADSQYILKVSNGNGNFSNMLGGDVTKLLEVKQWGNIEWTTMKDAFFFSENLDVTATDTPNLSHVTDISSMFYNCTNLKGNSSFSLWDTSMITNMSGIFFKVPNFNQDIGNWNTSKVTNMSNMLAEATNFNQDIGNWDTSNVLTLMSMFNGAKSFNQDIGAWNTANVTNMSFLFQSSDFNQNIGNWDTSKVTNMRAMFGSASNFNQNIGNWNTSNVTNMNTIFSYATNFNQNIASWDTSNVIDMRGLFSNADSFNQDIGNWNTSKVVDMSYMFSDNYAFNQNIGNWNTSNVQTLEAMFYSTGNFNQNINDWNTSKVTNMGSMFSYAESFNQDIGAWNTANVTDMSFMFESSVFNHDIGNWNTENVTDMRGMFYGSSNFNQNIGNWNIPKVKDLAYTFTDAIAFSQSLENWNLKSVIQIYKMFQNSNLSCTNYDKTLIGWSNNTNTPSNLSFTDNTNVVYSSPDAVTARNYLINTKGWTISGDLYNPSCALATSDSNTNQIQIYPNPAKEMITIQSNMSGELDFKITDVTGRLIMKGQSSDKRIDIQALKTGSYIVELKDKYGKKSVRKIIKK